MGLIKLINKIQLIRDLGRTDTAPNSYGMSRERWALYRCERIACYCDELLEDQELMQLVDEREMVIGVLAHLYTAILPEKRTYDEYQFTKIHHDILEEFDNQVTIALKKLGFDLDVLDR